MYQKCVFMNHDRVTRKMRSATNLVSSFRGTTYPYENLLRIGNWLWIQFDVCLLNAYECLNGLQCGYLCKAVIPKTRSMSYMLLEPPRLKTITPVIRLFRYNGFKIANRLSYLAQGPRDLETIKKNFPNCGSVSNLHPSVLTSPNHTFPLLPFCFCV